MAAAVQVGSHTSQRSRSAQAAKRGLYKGLKKSTKPSTTKKSSTTTTDDKSGSRYYPSEDVRQPKANRKSARPTQLKSTLKPGCVVIVLAGKYAGKQVIFLKQLESGLLLVTGPMKLNGVPLRRINQKYVIACTNAGVDVSGLEIPAEINDAFFAKAEKTVKSKADAFFSGSKKNASDAKKDKTVSSERATAQKNVDKPLLALIAKVDLLGKFLASTFSLSKGEGLHNRKF